MPDPIEPVGAMTKPPEGIGNPIDLYSKILGTQQQQLALQTGQAELPGVQAQASQSVQKDEELQRLAQFTSKAMHDPSYRNADGTPNVDKYQQDASRVAPVYGQDQIGKFTSNFRESIESRRAIQNLSSDQNQEIQKNLTGIAKNPNATPSDMLDMVQQMRANNSDPGFQRALDNVLMTMDRNNIQGSAARVSSFMGGEMSKTGMVDKGGQMVPVTTTEMGPNMGAVQGAGPAIGKTLAPQVTDVNGLPYQTGGGGSGGGLYGGRGAAPMGSGGSAKGSANGGTGSGPQGVSQPLVHTYPGPQPTPQQMADFGQYESGLNQRVRTASDVIPRLRQVDQLMQQFKPGGGAEQYSALGKKLQSIPMLAQTEWGKKLIDSVSGGNLGAAQEAEKYLFQTTFAGLKQSMSGDPARVAEFEAADKVFPNIGTDPRATKQIISFMSDQAQRDYSEQQALRSSRKAGTLNPGTWQSDYQAQLRSKEGVPGTPPSQVPTPLGNAPSGQTPQNSAQTPSKYQEGMTATNKKTGEKMVFKGGKWTKYGG